jgi:hypothetical protein
VEETYTLSNCEIMRLDVDDEHFYYGGLKGEDKQFYVGVTSVLDVAAPFPEGLRQYLRVTSFEEQKQRLEVTGARGKKLHNALDELARGAELSLKDDFPTSYEKDAIVTFIQFWRFLNPSKFETELIVADPKRRVAGQMDFNGFVEEWKLTALKDPNKYLEVDSENELQLKEDYLSFPNTQRVRIVIDWKFTGRNAYSHKIQVGEYKYLNNISKPGRQARRAFIWRYSPMHKFRFDFSESMYGFKEFNRIYDTFIDYSGEFPQPPKIRRYPEKVRLYERTS